MDLVWKLLIMILAEFAGSAMYLSLGCISGLTMNFNIKSHIDLAITFGLVLMVCVHVFRPFSGGHINPWVSTAAFMLGHIKWDVWLIYLVAQILGAFVGYGIFYVIVPKKIFKSDDFSQCKAEPDDDDLNTAEIMFAQFLCMSIFILMWAGSWDKRGAHLDEAFAVRIGLAYVACNICVGNYTGGSLNVARSIVPVVFHGGWEKIWQSVAGQFIATVTVPILWRYVFVNHFKNNEIEE